MPLPIVVVLFPALVVNLVPGQWVLPAGRHEAHAVTLILEHRAAIGVLERLPAVLLAFVLVGRRRDRRCPGVGVAVDGDALDEDLLALIREEPAGVDDEVNLGHRLTAGEHLGIRPGIVEGPTNLTRVDAEILIINQVPGVAGRTTREIRRVAHVDENALAALKRYGEARRAAPALR